MLTLENVEGNSRFIRVSRSLDPTANPHLVTEVFLPELCFQILLFPFNDTTVHHHHKRTYRSLLSEVNGSRLKRAGKNRLFGGWIVRITGRACPTWEFELSP